MSNRMETLHEEEFANLENVTSTVELIRHDEPTLFRVEKLETIASCVEPKPFPENFPNLVSCCNCFDLSVGLSVWIIFEAIFWLLMTVVAFYHEIMYIHSSDLFEFFDWMETFYSQLVFGDEIYFVDNRIRCELRKV